MRIILIVLFAFTLTFSATPAFQAGMSYCGFWQNVFSSPESDAAVDSMAATNVKWLSVCVWWFQETETSSTIFPFTEGEDWGTPTDESIRHLVEYAHARGMSVMLKPMVDPMDGAWRADINPTSWTLWFDSYRAMIAHYAVLAESLDVEQFCVGCEYLSSSATQTAQWLRVVDTTRHLFSGGVTYAANWWLEYEFITWFNVLDAIGIDAYFPVSDHANPLVSEIVAGWASTLDAIETFRDTMCLTSKPVIFTEIGCGSYTGAAMTPWDWDYTGDTPNQHEQANYYEGLFQAVYPRPWIEGFFIWSWDNPSTSDYRWGGSDYPYGFTPNGKLAQSTIRTWYATATQIDDKPRAPESPIISIYPNPFNSSCRIDGKKGSGATIYDIFGHKIRTIELPAIWDGKDENGAPLSSGVYFIENQHNKRTIILVK
jgi:hypothetical protein